MKKLVILLAILLVSVLIITGCSTASTTTVPTTTAKPTTTIAPTTTVAPTTVAPTTTIAPTTVKPTTTVAPTTTATTTSAAGPTITWEQGLLAENWKKKVTVTGPCVAVSAGWTTKLIVSLGKPANATVELGGIDLNVADPTLPGYPGVNGTDLAAFQAAYVGKNLSVTGTIAKGTNLQNMGLLQINITDPSQIKIIP